MKQDIIDIAAAITLRDRRSHRVLARPEISGDEIVWPDRLCRVAGVHEAARGDEAEIATIEYRYDEKRNAGSYRILFRRHKPNSIGLLG